MESTCLRCYCGELVPPSSRIRVSGNCQTPSRVDPNWGSPQPLGPNNPLLLSLMTSPKTISPNDSCPSTKVPIPFWLPVIRNNNHAIFSNYNTQPRQLSPDAAQYSLIPSHSLNRHNVYYIMYQRASNNPSTLTPTTRETQSSGVASQGIPPDTSWEPAVSDNPSEWT